MVSKTKVSKKELKQSHYQKGAVSNLIVIIILAVAFYGFYHFTAERKSTVISFAGKYKNIKTSLEDKITRKSTNNRNFKGYGVQVVATQKLPQAKQLMKDFSKDGYSAFILSSKNEGRTLYKVRLGPYGDKSAAELIHNKIKTRYSKNRSLKTSFVVYRP